MTAPGGPQDRPAPPQGPQDWAPPARPAPNPAAPNPPPPFAAAPAPAPPGAYGPPAAPPPGPYAAPPAGGYGWYGAPAAGLPMSSAGKRFGAYLLEGVLVLVTLVIGWLVWSLVVWSKGQTPAKQLLHMRTVDQSTARAASWGTMALRELVGKSILGNVTCGITTLVSCFMILGESRRGVWDQIANTIVVDDPQDVLAP